MDDVEAWLNGYDDEDEEGEYVGYEYPSMYGEETELEEVSKDFLKKYKTASKTSEKEHHDNGLKTSIKMDDKRISDKTWNALNNKLIGHEQSYSNRRRGQALATKKIGGRAKINANEEVEQLAENPFNQRLQKAPGGEILPAPEKGTIEKHGMKFKEGDMVVPHTGPHAGVPHKVTTARAGTVNIHPMVSVNKHKYDNTTIRAKHEHLSPYKGSVKEETDYKVSVDGLPDMYVKANSSSEVKNNLRKVVKNPEMIRGVDRVAKATLQKIFRDKAAGKDEVAEEVELDEISDEMKKKYIRAVADKGGILRKPRPASLAGIDKEKENALVKAFKGGSMQQYANLHKKSERRAEIGTKAIHSLKKEEVDVNEASDLRITKVYNKKKATYAVHSPDRKYYKEFDTMDAAKAHHAEKTGK
jgi:hypothetical protein